MSPVVIDTDRSELERRRTEALRGVGIEDETELERRVASGVATLDEYDAWAELDAVRFLLDHE